eukprot:13756929-Ditylum_brightwellii.AAC.1
MQKIAILRQNINMVVDKDVKLLVSQSLQHGCPLHAAQFFLRALQQMEYHMVTHYSVSKKCIKHSQVQHIYSLGQGTTDAPPNWTLISLTTARKYTKNTVKVSGFLTQPVQYS